MKYYSLKDHNYIVDFKHAVVTGIAPNMGLYYPVQVPFIDPEVIHNVQNYSDHELAFKAIKPFVGEDIPDSDLMQMIETTLTFPFELVQVEPNICALELFHGPTMAFKDVGAKFMANCLGYFSKAGNKKITVLVATSGDTGGAVANGFKGVDGVEVVVLYPSGKVSSIQEKQLTTLGGNIHALEVEDNFDACQAMVKQAFVDDEITEHRNLNSANSINISRWMAQMFYYLIAYKKLKDLAKPLVISVPSGNFGNIAAGMLVKKMGLPIDHFVASNNINDTVVKYMQTQTYQPKPSVPTISNAMDITDPSNFSRICKLWDDSFKMLQENFSAYSFSDEDTKKGISQLYSEQGYLADPHGVIGYLGLKTHLEKQRLTEYTGVFLETAHPAKFKETVEEVIGQEIQLPAQLQGLMDKPKQATKIKDYKAFKQFLIDNS